jgi:1-deoxy-D-xylulose 5-phosphate reductoisomerase
VTPEQALAHPTWVMGPVVTINSATMVNKALEVLEAHLLFDIPLDAIDVVVHPQSLVHSMVEFADGSTIAQASPPDMRPADRAGAGLAGPGARRRERVRLDDGVDLDLRAARRRCLPGRTHRARRGCRRAQRAGRLQRG